jgi:hypothetical protein
MNTRTRLLIVSAALATSPLPLHAHGPGHLRSDAQTTVASPQPSAAEAASSSKTFEPVLSETGRPWGASLSTGWESRHIHYGVDETGDYGAYTTEASVWIHNFIFSVWSGFGTGNDFQEWDFTAGYNLDLGPVFLLPGYNLRYSPGVVEEGLDSAHEGEDDHESHDEHEDEGHEDHAGHLHRTIGNEIFLVVGSNAIPYVTPTASVITDLNNVPGTFLEFRLDGEIPVWRDILTLESYALLGINLGYNTREYYGWNNFQFGMEVSWQINSVISVSTGIHYSVAMEALREIGQGNEVWANCGITFTY